jgi:hypothetical protein
MKSRFILTALIALPLWSAATEEEFRIKALSDGILSWTNPLSNAVYQIEWAPRLNDATWTTDWPQNLTGTGAVLHVEVPQFFRVTGKSYIEETDPVACYEMYSNALLDAQYALPNEVSYNLLPLILEASGTEWREFTNWVDGTVSPWVKVVTFKYTGGWTWNTLLAQTGSVTLSANYTSEIWVTPYPELYDLCKEYQGTHQCLRIQKALGLPPWEGEYGIVEFFIDPKYLLRPAPDPEVTDCAAGLAPASTTPFLQPNTLQGITEGYAAWFSEAYQNAGYSNTTNDLNARWPWTRLGYTYDYANTPNSPYGLSEYLLPRLDQTQYWGVLTIPIYIEAHYSAEAYGKTAPVSPLNDE